MSTHLLSQVKNFQDCHAGMPDGLEVSAVVDAVIQLWDDYSMIKSTEENGVCLEDSQTIEQIIADHALGCTVDACETALLEECEDIVSTRTGYTAIFECGTPYYPGGEYFSSEEELREDISSISITIMEDAHQVTLVEVELDSGQRICWPPAEEIDTVWAGDCEAGDRDH